MISTNTCTRNDNLVYLNKIFFNNSENASPIMTALETNTTDFTQQLSIGSNLCASQPTITYNCGCAGNTSPANSYDYGCECNCCCDLVITADTTFDITNSYILVRSFSLADPAALTAGDVTVEGLPVTTLTPNGNQFIAELNDIMPQITRCACKHSCESDIPGSYVMITAAGPWNLVATIVVEGTVYSNGSSCQFRICYNTALEPIVVTGPASFAFCNVDIPCQISGVSPTLLFDFDACGKLLNPAITVNCADGVCTPTLTGSLVVTPQVNLQVLRASMFNLGNCEIELPCDDMGQCNPCNEAESKCINKNNACQCCETNGFGF